MDADATRSHFGGGRGGVRIGLTKLGVGVLVAAVSYGAFFLIRGILLHPL